MQFLLNMDLFQIGFIHFGQHVVSEDFPFVIRIQMWIDIVFFKSVFAIFRINYLSYRCYYEKSKYIVFCITFYYIRSIKK